MLLSLVQLAVGVTVVFAPCPGIPPEDGWYSSCYEPATNSIYMSPDVIQPQMTLAHEYGHAYDQNNLTPLDRKHFQVDLGFKWADEWWGRGVGVDDFSPAETFAETYAMCALGKRWFLEVSRKRINRVCERLPAARSQFTRRAIAVKHRAGWSTASGR